MGIQFQPRQTPQRSWRIYLIILGLIVGGLIALQVVGLRERRAAGAEEGAAPSTVLLIGDIFVKQALAQLPGTNPQDSARQAIDYYSQAIPSPAAYRRIGVTREALLRKSGMQDFYRLDSPEAVRGLSKAEKAELSNEVAMWRDIYGPVQLTRFQADSFILRIRRLDIGPLKEVAIAQVYRRSGQAAKAATALESAKDSARRSILGASALGIFLVLGGIAGLVIAIMFLSRYGEELKTSPRPRIQPSVLLISFLVYFFSLILLGLIGQVILGLSGLEADLPFLVMQILVTLGAFALGLSALQAMIAYTGEQISEMGLRLVSLGRALKWGIGGYFAVLPFFAMAVVISQFLSQTIFRNVPTPEQPFGPMVAEGGPAEVAVVFVLAAVVAPIVEETFFRGALYGALRGRISVWPAAVLAAAIFAVAHPLPGGFLPILVLGTVLALLRERTGSLIPGMICHGLYNGIVLAYAWLLL